MKTITSTQSYSR